MKRVIILVMLVSCALALVFAQPNIEGGAPEGQSEYQKARPPEGQPNRQRSQKPFPERQFDGRRGQEFNRPQGNDTNRPLPPKAEDAAVSGNLVIVNGMIAVKDNDITYYAGGLHRFVGFIDGLKEGAAVTLEGKAITFPQNENAKFLRVQKLTLNGKDYDIAPPRMYLQNDQAPQHQYWQQPRQFQGRRFRHQPMNHSGNQKRLPRKTPQEK